jgi:hypothetical protein
LGAARLVLEIDIGERVPAGVADDEAPPIQLGVGVVDGPRRREAALRHSRYNRHGWSGEPRARLPRLRDCGLIGAFNNRSRRTSYFDREVPPQAMYDRQSRQRFLKRAGDNAV